MRKYLLMLCAVCLMAATVHAEETMPPEYPDMLIIDPHDFAGDPPEASTDTQTTKTIRLNDGEFTFDLKPGQALTIDNLPAGTGYQTWQDVPSGWILVTQQNTSGVISSMSNTLAGFTNLYQEGSASATIMASCIMENRPAQENEFYCELLLDGEPIQQKPTNAGGFIQFDTLYYTEEGVYTYQIMEKPYDSDNVSFDTHTETVTVTVTRDGSDNLVANTAYTNSKAVFINHYMPGTLTIHKETEGGIEANADKEFTFRIKLENDEIELPDHYDWAVQNHTTQQEP